ncbi:MAG: nitroreductase family deazaflavin-dependent oxidoreductase [Bacteroidales bacterium]|nr:nitroreductase family deazaflavin-dependent oxidoreductase [Bacteroidales bacterium]
MSNNDSDKVREKYGSFIDQHLATYLRSGGAEGHIVDMSHTGVPGLLPTLLLKTRGRRTGRESIVPLIYGCYGQEWVVIGSRGGTPDHPFWYLNLREQQETAFQVATQCFRASWRQAEGAERDAVWAYMEQLFPPYREYRRATEGQREIPVVMLRPSGELPVFTP